MWAIRLAVFLGFVFFVTTIPLGAKTLWQHATDIWKTEQTQELVDGVKRSSGPLVDKIKRGVEAGAEEMTKGSDVKTPATLLDVEKSNEIQTDVQNRESDVSQENSP